MDRKKRKRDKKNKKGLLGYGDYMKGISPELMMMNQMMGMSMMMNNPMAMRGMGAGMMPGMAGMMGMKASKKDSEKKKAAGRIEDKVMKRGDPRDDRGRKREKEGV